MKLDIEIKTEEQRIKLWCDEYTNNKHINTRPDVIADEAVKAFDKRFKRKQIQETPGSQRVVITKNTNTDIQAHLCAERQLKDTTIYIEHPDFYASPPPPPPPIYKEPKEMLERLAEELNKLEKNLNKCSESIISIKKNLVKMGMKDE
jgi:hypothetical protein